MADLEIALRDFQFRQEHDRREGKCRALLAIAEWRQPDKHAFYTDLGACFPPLWEAVRRENDKERLGERSPWNMIRPYRAVLARRAFEALLGEYERGWSRATGDRWWLHTIDYLRLKAHNDQIGKLAATIPEFPEDPHRTRR